MGHTRYSSSVLKDGKMEVFTLGCLSKVELMPDSQSFDDYQFNQQKNCSDGNQEINNDLLMEKILQNITSTPIGKVLKAIAELPDTRKQKIIDVRKRLVEGRYDLGERLDIALEKVLEDIDQ